MLKRYVIYTNDNGTDSYKLQENETGEEKYKELLGEEDSIIYFETHCMYVEVEDNEIVECWELFIPEYDNEEY